MIDLVKDLNEIGFIVIPFPKSLKTPMVKHIKMYLEEISKKQTHIKNADNNETSSANILAMSDKNYIECFYKPFRMYPDDVTRLIVDWIKREICQILKVKKADSNYVSPAERKINQKLHETSYDIFWRCVRPNKNDVGPAHCDYQFWNLAKNTEHDVPVPFSYCERWKLWVPLLGCVKDNMLQVMPHSHKEDVLMQVTETAFGKRPWLEPEWYEKNKNRFIVPIKNADDDCIIFHDRLIHRGQKNHADNLRISSEFTILTA